MSRAIGHSTWAACAAWVLMLLAAGAWALDPKVPFHHYRFDHWGPDEGLPQISVLTIAQDRLGYLWLGTQNGIARFDGSRFTIFDRNSSGVDTTLPTSSLATPDGRVWFGTPRGVFWIRGEQVHEIGKGAAMVGVLDIASDRDGRVLVATGAGVFAVAGERLRDKPEVAGPAYSLLRDGAAVWVGRKGAVTRMEAGTSTDIVLPDATLKVLRLARDGDSLWLGTQSGLRRFDLRTHALDAMSETGAQPVDSLLLDASGNLWVGTLDRLQRRHPGGTWETIEAGDLFAQPWIDAIFEDREGDLWLGSHRESLVRLRDSALSRIGTHAGLADPFTWSVLRDRGGALLVGTSHGLFEVDGDAAPRELVAASALPQAQVYSLDEDPDGTLWIGTRGGLALRRDGVVSVPPALAPLAGMQIDAVLRVGDDDHWIATLEGLFRYRNGALVAVGPHDGSPASKVRTILPADGGAILLGTDAGIFRVQDDRFTRLPGTGALDATFVPRMAWLKPGLLAITTMDRGLGLWRDGRLLLLGRDNGLPTVNGWTLDVIGPYLYVATIDGVYRVALADLPDPAAQPPFRLRTQVVVEGSQRGSGGRRFGCCNGGGDARTLREGANLWIASSAGAVRLDTSALPPPAAPPAALIENVRNGAKRFPGDAPLSIDGDSRDIEIDYTGLSLVDSARLEFRYRLAGYDDDWKDASTRRVAYYTHLPPGDFRFEVQARSPFGAWGAGVAPLPIRILPHWHERDDVRLAGIGLACLLALLAVLRHNAGLRSHARALRQAVDERTSELQLANERLDRLSRTDSLTGLANRRGIDTSARTRGQYEHGAALMIDIDRFKSINDEHGHDFGDRVLVALGEILRADTRADDCVLRWGGEEFLIVSRHLDIDGALQLAERIRAALAACRIEGGGAQRFSCSIGIAAIPVHPGRAGDLDASIAMADYALYRAKHEGRDRAIAVLLPADAKPGSTPAELRSEIERLDAAGRLAWRKPAA